MTTFVIDEDMPLSTGRMLAGMGYKTLDARDHGLRGAKDEDIFSFAQNQKAVLVTGDMGFGSMLKFPLGTHSGILIVHFPNEVSSVELNRQLEGEFRKLREDDFAGNLIILEPGKIRIRRIAGKGN